jgi:hypothetical protein
MMNTLKSLSKYYLQRAFMVGVVIILSACAAETDGVAPGSSASSAKTCDAPTTVPLSFGQQVGAAGTARGLWSDVKYIPSGVAAGTGAATGNVVQYSTNVGVAYVDSGAQVLKYAYWANGAFQTEVVYGDSAANITYVRLGFLSNSPNTGLPLIFFINTANNGQIMLATRNSASLTTPGTWTIQSIDSNAGAINKSLELAISPIDQVGLIYQATTTPTANNVRFVYCSSGCNQAINYVNQGTSANGRIDSGAIAAQTHMGIGWCQMHDGSYNPAVVYGASATAFQFAICATGAGNNLASCNTNAGWTRTTSTISATGASGLTSDLYLDPSIQNDTPKIMVKDVGGGAMKTYSTLVGCADVVTGTSYTAAGSSAITGTAIATFANSHMKLLKAPDYTTPANERFFLVANDALTAIKWSASSTNSFNGAWSANATGAIHTVALNAAGATNLGADLNTTTKQLISSYGTAASTYNITLGVVNNYSSPGDPGSASNIYFQLPVDDTGHIQLNATQYNNIAVAGTSTSRPAVAWVDFSSGLATTGKLMFAARSGNAATNEWVINPVPGVSAIPAPQYPSLAFDQNDRPWLAYWDAQTAPNGRFVLAKNSAVDGSGTWTSYTFPVTPAGHGAPAAQPAANSTAIAMSYSGGVATPVMIVIDNGTALSIKAASLNPTTGAWSSVTTIDTLATQGAAFLTADWSSSTNLITIAYQILTTGAARVKYTASTDAGATWPVNGSSPFALSNASQGEGATIKLNPVTNLPSIAYYDRANARLYFASCAANCTGTGTPTFSGTTTPVLSGIGISGLSALGNANLLTAGLSYSNSGNAYIVYNSGQLDTGALRMIDNTGGSMSSSAPQTIVSGVNGAFANAAATNGGIPWGHHAVRMTNGVLATAYIAPGNSLAITTCGD